MSSYISPTILVGSPEYHSLNKADLNGLIYLMMNLPTSCSLGCKKCALDGKGREMGPPISMDDRKKIICNAYLAGIRTLVIIGNGEPTENFPVMSEIVGAANTYGMSTIMFTTTNRLDEGQAKFYASHNTSIIVSLDSLQPDRYRWLTGNGNLEKVKANIELLRNVYSRKEYKDLSNLDKNVVRLGINTTVSIQNVDELAEIRAFAGEDMQFVANPPMKRGRLQRDALWNRLLFGTTTTKDEQFSENEYANAYIQLKRMAELHSSTGGHSSISDGVCSYFHNGVSVDTDGEFLTCGYADETARHIGNALNAEPEDFLAANKKVRAAFKKFTTNQHYLASCPVRDEEFQQLVKLL